MAKERDKALEELTEQRRRSSMDAAAAAVSHFRGTINFAALRTPQHHLQLMQNNETTPQKFRPLRRPLPSTRQKHSTTRRSRVFDGNSRM